MRPPPCRRWLALQDELESADGDGPAPSRSAPARTRVTPYRWTATTWPSPSTSPRALPATANAGQVWSPMRWSRISDGRAAVEVGTYSLKDLPDPTRIWRVAGDDTPPRATPARRTNVREPRTSFVGRAEELDAAPRSRQHSRLVTVVGPGGTGKTRLVSELALRGEESIPGGAWLVELATLEAPDQIVGATGAAVGWPRRASIRSSRCSDVAAGPCPGARQLRAPDRRGLRTGRDAAGRVPGADHALHQPRSTQPRRRTRLDPAAAARSTAPRPSCSSTGPPTRLTRRPTSTWSSSCARPWTGCLWPSSSPRARSGPRPSRRSSTRSPAGTDALERRGGESRQRSLDAVLEWSLDRLKPEVRDLAAAAVGSFPAVSPPTWPGRVLDRRAAR